MRVAVFGMGVLFTRFLLYKEKFMPDLEITCICDNDTSITGNKLLGIDVIQPADLRENILRRGVEAVLITVNNSEPIIEQLQRMNIWVKLYALRPASLQEFLCNKLPVPVTKLDNQSAINLIFFLPPPIKQAGMWYCKTL